MAWALKLEGYCNEKAKVTNFKPTVLAHRGQTPCLLMINRPPAEYGNSVVVSNAKRAFVKSTVAFVSWMSFVMVGTLVLCFVVKRIITGMICLLPLIRTYKFSHRVF